MCVGLVHAFLRTHTHSFSERLCVRHTDGVTTRAFAWPWIADAPLWLPTPIVAPPV